MDEDGDLDGRLQQLLGKRGQELVRGLVEEFGALHREIAGLKREVAALADYPASRWLVLDAAGAANAMPLPHSVAIEPDHLLRPRDGFYPVEYTAGGVPFRWTGPSVQFSFDLFVDRTNGCDLRLQALNSVDFEQQKNLMLLVDGEAVPLNLVPEGTGFAVSAALPVRADRRATSLVFILPAVIVPPGTAETRPLGIAFAGLSVNARTEPEAKERLAADASTRRPSDPHVDISGPADEDDFLADEPIL